MMKYLKYRFLILHLMETRNFESSMEADQNDYDVKI